MISLNELKQIRSVMPDAFQQQLGALNSCLELFDSDADFIGLDEPDALSEADIDQFHALKKALTVLPDPKKSDEELRQALQQLAALPAFLQKKAFPDQKNSPSILERMLQLENSKPHYTKGTLSAQLAHAVRYLELDLSPELSVKKLGSHRRTWAFPTLNNLPSREEAAPDTWAGRFYQLTKQSRKPNTAKDAYVYEHKCSDNTWRRLTAASRMIAGKQGEPVRKAETLEEWAAQTRENSLAVMTMRNEYTVEELRRGHVIVVAERLGQTRKDFTFPDKQAQEDAIVRAKHVLDNMQRMEGKAASSPEFTALKNAVQKFTKGTGNMAQRSADVLVAVENFTKGRKNVQRSPRAQECVNLALDALSAAVPNAIANPHVIPLIQRFNQVRSRANRISLKGFGAFRTNTTQVMLKRPEIARDPEQTALVTSLGQFHLGRIDPARYQRLTEMIRSNEINLKPLRNALVSGDQFQQDMATLLLEDLMGKPDQIASYKDLSELEMKNVFKKKQTQLTEKYEFKAMV